MVDLSGVGESVETSTWLNETHFANCYLVISTLSYLCKNVMCIVEVNMEAMKFDGRKRTAIVEIGEVFVSLRRQDFSHLDSTNC